MYDRGEVTQFKVQGLKIILKDTAMGIEIPITLYGIDWSLNNFFFLK